MSWRATAFVKDLRRDAAGRKLSAVDKCLLYTLADYYDEEKDCAWPSQPRLAEESAMSRATAQRVIYRLKDTVIDVIETPGYGNKYRFIGYQHAPTETNPHQSDAGTRIKPNPAFVAADAPPASPSDATPASPSDARTVKNLKRTKRIKPSGDAAPGDSVVTLFEQVHQLIMKAWSSHNGAQCPWGSYHAKQLSALLKEVPVWDVAKFETCVANRFKSDDNMAADPTQWIRTSKRKLSDYINGPIDRWGKPVTGGDRANSAIARRDDNFALIDAVASSKGFR